MSEPISEQESPKTAWAVGDRLFDETFQLWGSVTDVWSFDRTLPPVLTVAWDGPQGGCSDFTPDEHTRRAATEEPKP